MSDVQKLYVAVLGRPADPSGLAFFDALSHDINTAGLIERFSEEKEYRDRFFGMDDTQRVNLIYNSILGRDGEAAGIAYWTNQLKIGALTESTVAIAILEAAQGKDKATVEAKITAADLFTSHLDLPSEQSAYQGAIAAAVGRAFINSVDATHAGTSALADAMIYQIVSGEAGSPKPSDQMIEPAAAHAVAAYHSEGMTFLDVDIVGHDAALHRDLS